MKPYLLYSLLLTWLPAWVAAQSRPTLLALTDVCIIDACHRVPLPHQTILIRDERILEIFNTGSKPLPDSTSIIAAPGSYVIPGLIDSHVHLATDPDGMDNRTHTLDVLQRMLYSGITSVRDMAGDARILAGLSREALSGRIMSPAIYYSALMAGPDFFEDPRTQASSKGGQAGAMPYMQAITDSTNLVVAVAWARGSGARGIKLYADLPATRVSEIAQEARRQDILVWGHAWLQQAIPSQLVTAGVSSVSHAPLLVHEVVDTIPDSWKSGIHPDSFWDTVIPDMSQLFALMNQQHTILDATLLTYQLWGESDSAMGWDYEIGRYITRQAYKAGVCICTGTDDDQQQFVQDEMRLLVKEVGFTPLDAIVAATFNGACALGLEDAVGLVKPGMQADLLVLAQNPLDNIEHINSVQWVVKAGRAFQPGMP